MLFEWDDDKALKNIEKHGVSFDLILEVDWRDEEAVEDDRADYGQRRLLAYIQIGQRLYVVVYNTRRSSPSDQLAQGERQRGETI